MLLKQQIKVVLIITIISCNGAKPRVPKAVYFISSKAVFNPEYIQDHYITIGANRLTATVILNIARNFVYDPWAGISIIYQHHKTSANRTLFQYDINVCTILGKQGSQLNNFVSGWINNFWKYGDLPRSCPVKKGNYTWVNLKAEKLNIPNFLSNGRYLINIKTYFRHGGIKDSIANLTIDTELKAN